MEERGIYSITSKAFGVIAGGFIIDSLEDIIMWLIVMFSVVLCDLITGVRKSLSLKEKVRFSRAWRATMGKMVTYFSFVVMAVFIDRATDEAYSIDKWSILFVCFIEVCSIIANILKPKGYNFNLIAALSVFAKKVFSIDKEDSKEIITKNKEDE